MKAEEVSLELALVTHPQHVLEIGPVACVPAVGDYVQRVESGWYGYVKSRRFTIAVSGKMTARLWLQAYPP